MSLHHAFCQIKLFVVIEAAMLTHKGKGKCIYIAPLL